MIDNQYIDKFPEHVKERLEPYGERKESSGTTKFTINTHHDEELTRYLIAFFKEAVTPPPKTLAARQMDGGWGGIEAKEKKAREGYYELKIDPFWEYKEVSKSRKSFKPPF